MTMEHIHYSTTGSEQEPGQCRKHICNCFRILPKQLLQASKQPTVDNSGEKFAEHF